jgi:cyclophilin family peptidyl-prolyl cis-trans isomerase
MEQLRLQQLQRRRRQRFFLGGGSAAVIIIVVAVLAAVLSGGSTPKKKAVATTTTSISVPLIKAPTKLSCPKLNGTSPHYTSFAAAPPMCIDPAKTYTATIVTDIGTMTAKIVATQDPKAANDFVYLAGYHFYDGTVFHRVCTGFVDQGGDPTGTGSGGPGYSFNGGLPTSTKDYVNGALALANSGSPSSDGSQFFIVVGNGGNQLSANYSYFGKVTGGLNVVTAINNDGSSATVNSSCPPKVMHRILKVTVTES